jgi:hypothetical protein
VLHHDEMVRGVETVAVQVTVLQALGYAKEPAQPVLDYVCGASKNTSDLVRSQAAETLKVLNK